MPPIPTPRTSAPKASGRPSAARAGRESGESRSSSAAGSSAPRTRTTKNDRLKADIARVYMVMGTMLKPFGRFYPVLEPIGDNFRELSVDAADAWMELGEKDPRILQWWQSVTQASAYGNVIGIHLAIFAAAIPGAGFLSQANQPPDAQDFYAEGRNMGLSDDEIAEAMRAAGMGTPARDMSTGGPGDTIRTGGRPMPPAPAPPVQSSAPRSSIVTPEQLGVTQPGENHIMPTDASPPNGRGQ